MYLNHWVSELNSITGRLICEQIIQAVFGNDQIINLKYLTQKRFIHTEKIYWCRNSFHSETQLVNFHMIAQKWQWTHQIKREIKCEIFK